MSRSFSIENWGVRGDGVTDDTLALNAALGTGGVIVFPPGHYLCNTATGTFGGLSYALRLARSNTRLIFEPGAELVTTADLSVLAIGGVFRHSSAAFSRWLGDPDNNTYHGIGPIDRGTTAVTLTDPASAASFTAGDFVHVRTGSLAAGRDTEPDAELNRVLAVEGATLVLRWPTAKAYSQEWFTSGTSGKTSTVDTGNPATFGVANITDRTISNVSVEGLTLDTSGTVQSPIVVRGGLVGLTIDGLSGMVGGSPLDGIEYRHGRFRDWDMHLESPTAGPARWIVSGASTVTDTTWQNINGTATGPRMLYAHIHEGCTNVGVKGLRVVTGAGQNDATPLSVRARASSVLLEDVDVTSDGTMGGYVDDTCTDITLVRPRVAIRGTTGKGLRVLGGTNRVIDAHSDTLVTTV